ncbi:MAG: heme NO-binding domain-containing protein [Gammaproteobacteria bacterium]|nr:heme NO-binding domain-containing protein [Gammaproteobacteria bacterium]MDH5800809.1 heme NO-binding domain-containing protein [Gammaproteobacteria bacterium]
MYGMIFEFMRGYVQERHGGKPAWRTLLKATGRDNQIYFPSVDYPDRELVELAVTAAKTFRLPTSQLLEDFGAYMAPRLLDFYKMYIDGKSWRSLELLENAGGCIRAVERHNPNRKPPRILTQRLSLDKLVLQYQSRRKLCYVAKGVVRGLGEHFQEKITIVETQCMLKGADSCVMTLEREVSVRSMLDKDIRTLARELGIDGI